MNPNSLYQSCGGCVNFYCALFVYRELFLLLSFGIVIEVPTC